MNENIYIYIYTYTLGFHPPELGSPLSKGAEYRHQRSFGHLYEELVFRIWEVKKPAFVYIISSVGYTTTFRTYKTLTIKGSKGVLGHPL